MSPEVPTTRPRGRPPVRMSVLPKDEDSKLNCSACAGKSFYHKVGCPRRGEAMQLKETMKFLRQAEREEKAEAKKAKLTKVEVLQESKAIDEDMEPRLKGEDESPNKKQRVEHTVNHVTGASDVEVLATNEEMETYIECDGTYSDEDDGEQLEPSQVKAAIEREVKQMHELDVAEESRRDEVPEGVRIWSGRWCHRKKAGGVRSRYVVRQYHTEWSEDAFCGTPGWRAVRLLLAVASLMRWKVMPGDFSTAFMHTPLLESDEYWIEPPREVVPDTRIVWKLKKALNGLVTASKRFQQHLFRLLHDLGFECCPLLVERPNGQWSARGSREALRGVGQAHCHEAGAAVALQGCICLPGHEALEHQIRVRGDAEGRVYRGHPYHCGTGRIACSRWKRCSNTWDQGQAEDQGR